MSSKPYSISRFDQRGNESPAPEHGRFKSMREALKVCTQLNRKAPRSIRYVVVTEE